MTSQMPDARSAHGAVREPRTSSASTSAVAPRTASPGDTTVAATTARCRETAHGEVLGATGAVCVALLLAGLVLNSLAVVGSIRPNGTAATIGLLLATTGVGFAIGMLIHLLS